MTPVDTTLFDLAQRFKKTLPGDPQRFREALEASLLPLIRCALRSGIGHPSLVRWVQQTASPNARDDPQRAARPMARALCERLLERLDPLPARETVVGP